MRIRFPLLTIAVFVALTSCGSSDDTGTTELPPETTVSVTTTLPTTSATTATTTSTPTSTTTTTIADDTVEIVVDVVGGEIRGGGRISVPLDSKVRLIVTVDVADEVHVHGYDLFADTAPEEPAAIEFSADIPGIFEVELESAHALLVELVVEP